MKKISVLIILMTFFLSFTLSSCKKEEPQNASQDNHTRLEKEEIDNISFIDQVVEYDGNVHSLEISGTLPNGVTVEYQNNNQTNVGTYEVIATFIDTTGNYNVPEPMKATLEITKKTITGISFKGQSFEYDGSVHSLEISGTLPDGITVEYQNNNQTNVGTYEVIATFTDTTGNYIVPEPMTATLNITKVEELDISFKGESFEYDGSVHSLEISGTLPDGITVEYQNNNQTNVGTYEVIATFTDTTGNYNVPKPMKATLEITKKAITGISFKGQSFEYDGSVHSLEISGTLPDGVTVEYINNNKTNAGTYDVVAVFIDTTGNYKVLKPMTATLNIMQVGELDISFEGYSVEYDGSVHSLEISGTLPNGVTVEYQNNNQTNAGKYEVIATFIDTTGNYNVPEPMKATLEITKKTITGISLVGNTLEYDEKYHKLIINGSLPNGVNVEYQNNNQTNAGTYEVIATFVDTTGNYNVPEPMKATLEITKKAITGITFENDVLEYDGMAVSLKVSGELPTGVSVSYKNNNKHEIGTYEVTASFSDSTGNYIVPDDMSATLVVYTAEQYYDGDEFEYYIEGIYASIVSYSGTAVDLKIPTAVEYEGDIYAVIAIGSSCFENDTTLKSVTICEGMIAVGAYAFKGCTNIETVLLPSSLQYIYTSGFYGCTSLKFIALPSNLESIGNYSFYECNRLNTINIPSSCSSIGEYAFCECSSLITVNMPATMTSIGKYAFAGCSNLSSIAVPEGITSINEGTFSGCNELRQVNIPSTVTIFKNASFYGCSILEEITLPEGTKVIENSAFYSCSKLKSIVLPKSLENIGDTAFMHCYRLVEVYNLSALELKIDNSNGYVAYYSKVIKVSLDKDTSIIMDESGYYFINDDANKYYLIDYAGTESNITLPTKIKGFSYEINQGAFKSNTTINYVDIPNEVTVIGDYAFANCINLYSVVINKNITSIPDNAFSGCYRLVEIYNLSSIEINVTDYTENGCIALYALVVQKSKNNASKISITDDGFIYVYGDDGSYYLVGYQGDEDDIILPEKINNKTYSLIEYSFYRNGIIKSVVIPKTITRIPFFAFDECVSLTEVYHEIEEENIGDISIGMYNDSYKLATKYYYSSTKPEEDGNYWYYDSSGHVTKW